jgi:mannose-1-phosphate guanylyltransferase/mannose-6-phosphate isomerase
MNSSGKDIRKKIIKDARPWGSFKQYACNEKCSVKIITVNPNQMLSSQTHKKRDELMVILDDGLKVELDDKILLPNLGDEIVINKNIKHRVSSLGKQARILEVSFGFFDEDDIERFEDMYGRN